MRTRITVIMIEKVSVIFFLMFIAIPPCDSIKVAYIEIIDRVKLIV